MRKKFSFIIATSIFLLLLVPSISLAEIDEDVMTPGDTFIYSVTEFDVPWEDLLGVGDIGFPVEDLVLDLSGSTLGVKVMAADLRDGYYMLNSYIVLGKEVRIPIPEESLNSEVKEIFGTEIVIPEGVGFGIGSNIPGSDYLGFIDSDYEDYPGLPFYFDANEWDQYKTMFEDLADQLDNANTGVTLEVDEKNDEFIVTISGHAGGEGAQTSYTYPTTYTYTYPYTTTYPYYTETTTVEAMGPDIDADVTLEVAWHAKGDYAGVFKRVKGEIDGDIGDVTNTQMNVEVSFDEKRSNPLPDAILDEETITLEMTETTFDYNTDGWFDDNEDLQDQLGEMQDTIDDADGEDIYEFEVTDVEGCFYETDISAYDGTRLKSTGDPVWWNGFVGSPGYKYDSYYSDPWDNWYIYSSMPLAIIPLLAPGITPDWDMWQASTLSISSILEVIETAVTSSSAESALSDLGLTLDKYDITYEMRGNKDYKFFYYIAEVDLAFDSTDYSEWPYDEDSTADVTASVEMWLGYTADGLIASMGVMLSLEANLDNFPFYSEFDSYGDLINAEYDDGSITMDLNADIANKDIKDVPDPTSLPKDTQGEQGGGGGIPTPGFSIIPALVLIAAIAVVIKRRK